MNGIIQLPCQKFVYVEGLWVRCLPGMVIIPVGVVINLNSALPVLKLRSSKTEFFKM